MLGRWQVLVACGTAGLYPEKKRSKAVLIAMTLLHGVFMKSGAMVSEDRQSVMKVTYSAVLIIAYPIC